MLDQLVLEALGISDLSEKIKDGLIASIQYREEKSRS
jgi:hypothetical protein